MNAMGQLAWASLGITLITLSGVARAEPAPAPQWSGPAPPPAAPAPVPTAPAVDAPPPVATAPIVAPAAPAAPVAAAPVGYPYPVYPVYPPPPGYEYYYRPPAPPKPRFNDDAAVSSTPFFDLVLVGANWENRYSEFLILGAQAGVFVAGRVRLTARIAFPMESVHDEYYSSGFDQRQVNSKALSLLYGASAGIVAVRTPTFVMSPGLAFGRTDVSDYGSMLAVSMPFDWVLATGLRVGLELNLGRAFGGRYGVTDCSGVNGCADGTVHAVDRPAGTAFWLQFNFGFGFNHPQPLPLPPPAP